MHTASESEKDQQWISIGKAAKYLGVSRDTLRRWEQKGRIKAFRSPTNRRYYTQKQLDELMLAQKSTEKVKKPKKGSAFKRGQVLILIGTLSLIVIAIFILYRFHLVLPAPRPPLSPLPAISPTRP